jgi:DNA repair photolyase
LNLYGGCSHFCKYCYNKAKFTDPNYRIKKSSLGNIEYDLKNWHGVRQRVHLTFVGDPYDLGRDNKVTTTRDVLKLFRKFDHPFQILTKGGTKAAQDFDLYDHNDMFGCTLTLDNDIDSNMWEPGAASPQDRIESLKLAHAFGIKTWVSLEPVLDPDQTLHLIDLTHEFVDFYGVGKLNHDAEREKSIDWKKFRTDAESKLKEYGKDYKIKQKLKEAS